MEKIVCPGFQAAGIAAGIKDNGKRDLGLLFSKIPSKVGAIFTRNSVQAAPVILDRKRVQSGFSQAIIVNSGNANCCNGERGLTDARAMGVFASTSLGIAEEMILVASTGVIGQSLPIEKIQLSVPELTRSLKDDGFSELALSIMTTDTMPKLVSRQGHINGKTFTVTGVAKGAGMIRPDMATMLCFICTDIDAEPEYLSYALWIASERSFNRISIDGDNSTNDTAVIMANGLSGAAIENSVHKASFQRVLDDLCLSLAKMIVQDGEGATKMVEIVVKGALSDEEAYAVASKIGNSNLVKTAFFGEDANWGRILAAAGSAGVPFDTDSIDIFFDDVLMVEKGKGLGLAAEKKATQVMKRPAYTITLDLKAGDSQAFVYTCDFTLDYVRINADYRS